MDSRVHTPDCSLPVGHAFECRTSEEQRSDRKRPQSWCTRRDECTLGHHHAGPCGNLRESFEELPGFVAPISNGEIAGSRSVFGVLADEAERMADVPVRHSVLMRAETIINGQRRKDYGSPLESFNRLAKLWWAYITTRPDPDAPLSAEDAGCMSILMKISRFQNGYHDDSVVDIAGYAGCLELVQREREGRL